MTYRILDENMPRLEKKLARIGNKCRKYGNDFTYEVVGEEYADVTMEDGETRTLKFSLVEVEGTAIINDWEFICTIEHTEKGNIFRGAQDKEIPQKYFSCGPVCEHCNNKRHRKDTYIVQNTVTKEFKQVGGSCLADFTHGMSAEGIAAYLAMFDELVEGEAPLPGGHYTSYIKTEEALRYIAETIQHFGFVKSDGDYPTKIRAKRYFDCENGGYLSSKERQELRREMAAIHFNADSPQAKKLTSDALSWLASLDKEKDGVYLHNLRTVCDLEYVDFSHFGLLASLFPSYNKSLVIEEKKRQERENNAASKHVGNVGDRIEVEICDFRVATSWYTQYGYTAVYLITGSDGNIYTWKTGNDIPEDAAKLVGTIKEHKEYNGVKQTELTRCRITEKKKEEQKEEALVNENPGKNDIDYFYEMLELE